jgi:hypothetical protein
LPGEVCAQTRASLTLLAHQYQGAGLAQARPESAAMKMKSSSLERMSGREKNLLANLLQYGYCVYNQYPGGALSE